LLLAALEQAEQTYSRGKKAIDKNITGLRDLNEEVGCGTATFTQSSSKDPSKQRSTECIKPRQHHTKMNPRHQDSKNPHLPRYEDTIPARNTPLPRERFPQTAGLSGHAMNDIEEQELVALEVESRKACTKGEDNKLSTSVAPISHPYAFVHASPQPPSSSLKQHPAPIAIETVLPPAALQEPDASSPGPFKEGKKRHNDAELG
jgi:hypothetical protein